ncbi:Two-component response regulator ORR24 [Camellia lanceoleosa]|uniref:Two-component response regulator ORR24 n=1 Tax=Camellia lanceoleosa TaxID=1840588 RepID=A0ACC0FSI1_9ERIC|nr:Two-component response regulator ORR24 [Camellia lanceoleosa]
MATCNRRKKFESKNQNKSSTQDKAHQGNGEGEQGGPTTIGNSDRMGSSIERERMRARKRKVKKMRMTTMTHHSKKPRVVWSIELQGKFVAAVNQLGIESDSLLCNECLWISYLLLSWLVTRDHVALYK